MHQAHKRPRPTRPARLVVAVSGKGRSLSNFLHWQKKTSLFAVCGVISSSPQCPANAIAREQQLPLFVSDFTGGDQPSPELSAWLWQLEVDWIALAGFLKIFPTAFAPEAPWKDRILNIHPSLLPAFAGKNMYGNRVHAAVLAAGATESGASVHFVNERYDEGQVIAQVKVPVAKDDETERLAKRVFEAECFLYPQTLLDLISGFLPLKNNLIYQYPFKGHASFELGS